jgi:hypothetical protein
MPEIGTSGLMSGDWKPVYGWTTEALSKGNGEKPLGSAYEPRRQSSTLPGA